MARAAPAHTATPLVPDDATLVKLREAARGCRACPLWKRATQTVFGESSIVFLTNCEDSVFSFDADLTLRWSANLTAVFPGGLTLARDGTLLVTSFEGLRAYRAP